MKIRRAFIILTAVFSLSGCDFFTTSLGKDFARDNTQNYEKQSASDLLELASRPEVVNDPKATAEILAALGKKDNLTSLSPEEKNTILELLLAATITSDSVADSIKSVQELKDDSEVVGFFDSMFENIGSADMKAVTILLSDDETVSQLDPLTACMASMCLLSQVAKKENESKSLQDVQDSIKEVYTEGKNIETSMNDVIGTEISEESKDAFGAALNCIEYYKDHTDSIQEVVVGNMSIDQIFGAFGK